MGNAGKCIIYRERRIIQQPVYRCRYFIEAFKVFSHRFLNLRTNGSQFRPNRFAVTFSKLKIRERILQLIEPVNLLIELAVREHEKPEGCIRHSVAIAAQLFSEFSATDQVSHWPLVEELRDRQNSILSISDGNSVYHISEFCLSWVSTVKGKEAIQKDASLSVIITPSPKTP